jgi:hypothetical protein
MIKIKQGYAKVTQQEDYGFNFDHWVLNMLNRYDIANIGECCNGGYHLVINPGIIKRSKYNNNQKSLFNLEKWLKKMLIYYGVVADTYLFEGGEVSCCPTKEATFLQSDALYFTKKRKNNDLSLEKRLYLLLNDWDLNPEDPCCS